MKINNNLVRFFVVTFFVIITKQFVFAQKIYLDWPPGVDEQTVALWLFDEPMYPWMTLTDASPNQFDLRLAKLGEIIDGGGKFGNALQAHAKRGSAAEYACVPDLMYRSRLKPFSLAIRAKSIEPAPTPEAFNIGWMDWTFEFWFKTDQVQQDWGIVFTLGKVNTLALDKGSDKFLIKCNKLPEDLVISTNKSLITDGEWHHLAFSFDASERQVRHFIDGQLQPLPEKGGFLPMIGEPGALSLGNHSDLDTPPQMLFGFFDEMRLSDTVRYKDDFSVPASFSNNYIKPEPSAHKPTGPPLLFEDPEAEGPINIGDRKHLFIDDVLLARQENVSFVTNPPKIKEITDFKSDKPWDPTPRFGNGLPDVTSIFDAGDEVRLCYYNGAFWGGKRSAVCVARSKDGLHWEKPNVGTVFWTGMYGGNPATGTFENNIVLLNPSQGTMFKDSNPNIPESEQFKYITWCMQRGIYVFVSPDGYHWRRNETIALPLEPGGGCEAYWDDQKGKYIIQPRAEGQLADYGNKIDYKGREVAYAESDELFKAWNFNKIPNPKRRQTWDFFTLPSVTQELPRPIPPDSGQVYRSRAIKYEWAPDVYVAFAWRYFKKQNIRPGCELMVSRDGVNWQGRGAPYYITTWNVEDKPKMQEALSIYGMVRRGNEIWQYGQTRFTSHAGANYRGNEFEGGLHDFLFRMQQRIDGFVSIDAGKEAGTIITKPIVFEGNHLELNVDSKESVRVAMLDENGNAFSGFALEDCIPIREDNVQTIVSWEQGKGLSELAGKTVILKIELKDAKLYAFEFSN